MIEQGASSSLARRNRASHGPMTGHADVSARRRIMCAGPGKSVVAAPAENHPHLTPVSTMVLRMCSSYQSEAGMKQ